MTDRLFDPPHGQGIEAWHIWRDALQGLEGEDATAARAHADRMIAIMTGEAPRDPDALARLRDSLLDDPPKTAP